jgi:hypothetical protein
MTRRLTHRKGEQGAIIIQVAISLFMLMCFLVFVCDYGVVWSSRGQAQNSADAGALAGAIARGYDDFTNPPPAGGVVQTAATLVAQTNLVWRQAGGVVVSYNCPTGVTGGGCVRVDVYRDGTNGSNTLPVYFGPLLNVTSQSVRATATAQALPANATNCLKPWAVADKWQENVNPPWTQMSTYDPPTDVYTEPVNGVGGTGFSNKDANGNLVNYGMQLTLKLAHPNNASISSGWAMDLSLNAPSAGGGGNGLKADIVGCTTDTVAIATPAQQCTAVDPSSGCVGVLTGGMTGPSIQGVNTLLNLDSGASWSDAAKNGTGGVVNSAFAVSPRIVPVAVFDPALYLSQGYNGSNGIIKVVNILGFFLEGFCNDNSFFHESYLPPCTAGGGNDLVGRLVPFSGTNVPTGAVAGPSAFGQVIRLIR